MQPPYLAEKLPELSDSEAKQAFQLVFIKHSVFAMQNNSIISALLWLDVTKLRSSKQPSPARLAALLDQQSLCYPCFSHFDYLILNFDNLILSSF